MFWKIFTYMAILLDFIVIIVLILGFKELKEIDKEIEENGKRIRENGKRIREHKERIKNMGVNYE